ncbi:MAG: hypothetical protein HC932_00225 [Thermales bacterium]|nr:hypothetical protein [Thermales bacterium]
MEQPGSVQAPEQAPVVQPQTPPTPASTTPGQIETPVPKQTVPEVPTAEVRVTNPTPAVEQPSDSIAETGFKTHRWSSTTS